MSKSGKEELVKGVVEEFFALDDDAKNKFVDDTLNGLIYLLDKPKSLKKLLKSFFKRGRPTNEDLETLNQLIVTFLYATKDEYRHQLGKIVFTLVSRKYKIDVPDFSATMEKIKALKWLHLGLKPETYNKLNKKVTEMNLNGLDEFFIKALDALEKVK